MNIKRHFSATVLGALLLAGCGARVAPATLSPEGRPTAVSPTGEASVGDASGATPTVERAQAEAGLRSLVEQAVERQGILGMGMAVRLADGSVVWTTAGHTNPAGDEPWSVSTRTAIASITKTFTAVVVMQLVEEKKLSLDDTVQAWFPGQPNGERITVRMLLSHTSGLANYAFGTDVEKWTRAWTPEELIAEANKAGPVDRPGSRVAHYANTNYIMLGRIIEQVTGNSWAHEVAARITQPLGLKDTALVPIGKWNEAVIPGYLQTADGYRSTVELPWYAHSSTAWAAGGLVSTAADLMAFASALFDGELVSPETLAVMAQPVGTGDGRAWALGGAVTEVAGHPVFGMGGDTTGYHAFLAGCLDSKVAVIALINTEDGDVIAPSMAALQQSLRPALESR